MYWQLVPDASHFGLVKRCLMKPQHNATATANRSIWRCTGHRSKAQNPL